MALANIMDIDIRRLPHQFQQIRLALALQLRLQRRSRIEMILYGALVAPVYDDYILNAALYRLLDDILYRRLVHYGQHLLGLGLGGGKEPCAEPRRGNNGFFYLHHGYLRYYYSMRWSVIA